MNIKKQIKIIEKYILNVRKQSMEKNIWLFILGVSINSLPNEYGIIKFTAFILGIFIYIYYLNTIFTEKSFNSMYNKLLNKINLKYSYDKAKLEYFTCKIKSSQMNNKSSKFNLFLYILLVIFYFITFILFCIQFQY